MWLCDIGTVATFPAVWGELTKVPPKIHQAIIQQHVDEMADEIGDGISLVVTSR